MMDMVTPSRRSEIMACIKSKDTKPERLVRSLLHRMGYRFRLHRPDLPGKPDIVLPRFQAVIFVHGCFWHGHNCKDGRRPKSNTEYWNEKLDRNVDRHRRNMRLLRRAGWRPLVIWECQCNDEKRLRGLLQKAIRGWRTAK